MPLCPSPAICGNTNHIQCVRLRPAESSARTSSMTRSCASTKRCKLKGSPIPRLELVARVPLGDGLRDAPSQGRVRIRADARADVVDHVFATARARNYAGYRRVAQHELQQKLCP